MSQTKSGAQRGGARPGAGAPKGNINALRTGAHSKQIAELVEKLDEGFWILDKKRKRMVWVARPEDRQKLDNGGIQL